MIRGPKYKICRMVGDRIYPKCQTPKYAARTAARGETKKRGRMGGKSEFGAQLLEKQKVRYTYGLSERQFANEVERAHQRGGKNVAQFLLKNLELRLDNVVFRVGLAPSRAAARQLVSHGHLLVNGTRVSVPSYRLSLGDQIVVREGSRSSPLFTNNALWQKGSSPVAPVWLRFTAETYTAEVTGEPLAPDNASFNLSAVLEFYSRA